LSNREALQRLLRWKREQIDPVELGWPQKAGRGRRARGLSQAQVAQALFVTEKTYADLERGNTSQPTAEFLDSVAKVLRMEERERAALYVYALGYEPPLPMDPMAGTVVNQAWQVAVDAVSGQPCYINDVAWNVLAANEEFKRNLMRWMLLCEDAREHHLVDWETRWAPRIAAQLRTAVATHPGNCDLQQLHKDVNEDPVAGPIYRGDHSLAYIHPDGDTRPMRHAGYVVRPGSQDRRSHCCSRHLPSQVGTVTMCAAQPFGSPGARFFLLPFVPHV
jgi:transcriptional regulator with XRE-family HTH domain